MLLWVGNIAPLALLIVATLLPGVTGLLANVSGLLAGLAAALSVLGGWWMKFSIIVRASQVQGYAVGKLQRGRPTIRPPVRRKKDRFVFDREYKGLAQEGPPK